jgi:agmatine deiminase
MGGTVYITDALRRYPNVYIGIISACKSAGIRQGIIDHTKNIWCRDYMPVQVNDHFVRFQYKSGLSTYDMKKYPQLNVPEKCWSWLGDVRSTNIVLDGGNCIQSGSRVFITDIVFKHNPKYRKTVLLNKLERLLDAEVVLIPIEPYDYLGHSDGILKPISDKQVFINDYSVMRGKTYAKYYSKLINTLVNKKIDCIPFPYAYYKQPKMSEKEFRKKYPDADDFNPGFGYFINFLRVGKMVIAPVFGIEEDEKAISLINRFFDKPNLHTIDCSDICMEGGLINCVTWEVKQ